MARNRSNLLVAALGAVDMLFCIYFMYTRLAIVTAQPETDRNQHQSSHQNDNTMTQRQCFYIIAYGIFAEGAQATLNFALAIDRIIRLIATKR